MQQGTGHLRGQCIGTLGDFKSGHSEQSYCIILHLQVALNANTSIILYLFYYINALNSFKPLKRAHTHTHTHTHTQKHHPTHKQALQTLC